MKFYKLLGCVMLGMIASSALKAQTVQESNTLLSKNGSITHSASLTPTRKDQLIVRIAELQNGLLTTSNPVELEKIHQSIGYLQQQIVDIDNMNMPVVLTQEELQVRISQLKSALASQTDPGIIKKCQSSINELSAQLK